MRSPAVARDVLGLDTAGLRSAYAAGALSPTEALEATLDRIAAVDPALHSVAYLDADRAREAARRSAARWAAGAPLSALDGVPVSIKDSVHASGTPWRHGAAANRDLPAGDVDAPPAARLAEAGAVVFGKTTMPDFGMSGSGVSSLYGIVRNPWNLAMNPGGSSAGAGAGLAAGIGWASVGSDIAGSVRLPAAHCGVVALKPTQGRIPHLAPSTVRSAGPMARSTAEVAELFAVLSRPDPRDLYSLPGGPLEVAPGTFADHDVAGLRVGLLLDMGYGFGVHEQVRRVVVDAAEALVGAGADVAELPAVFATDPYPALDRLFQVRARAELLALAADRRDQVHPTIVRWSAGADALTGADHERDLNAVAAAAARYAEALTRYDVVLSPVLPGLGFRAEDLGIDPDRPLAHCSFTCWANQSGQPAASVPFGLAHGMPVAVQVIGPRFADERVLRVTGWLERHRRVELGLPIDPRDLPAVPAELYHAPGRPQR